MNDLLFACSQMAVLLAFHIIFAVVGIGMPALAVVPLCLIAAAAQASFILWGWA